MQCSIPRSGDICRLNRKTYQILKVIFYHRKQGNGVTMPVELGQDGFCVPSDKRQDYSNGTSMLYSSILYHHLIIFGSQCDAPPPEPGWCNIRECKVYTRHVQHHSMCLYTCRFEVSSDVHICAMGQYLHAKASTD